MLVSVVCTQDAVRGSPQLNQALAELEERQHQLASLQQELHRVEQEVCLGWGGVGLGQVQCEVTTVRHTSVGGHLAPHSSRIVRGRGVRTASDWRRR